MIGNFISIEGVDGAGKSTQMAVVADTLREHDLDVVLTREPGGTPLGEALREILLGKGELTIGDESELLMMFAARCEHVNCVIKPALAQGKWVVSDRFVDASFAYQGAKGVSNERIQQLAMWSLGDFSPELTLFFDLPIEQGLARVNQRGVLDRFEQTSLDYKRQVQAIYQQRVEAEPDRIKTIDASQNVALVSQQVKACLLNFIKTR